MNSTNVPSNRDNPAVVVGQTIPTDKGLEMPPKTAKWGLSREDVRKQDVVISPVEKSKVREDGKLEKEDGTTISMRNPKAYQTLLNAKNQKAQMKEEKNQSGIEIG